MPRTLVPARGMSSAYRHLAAAAVVVARQGLGIAMPLPGCLHRPDSNGLPPSTTDARARRGNPCVEAAAEADGPPIPPTLRVCMLKQAAIYTSSRQPPLITWMMSPHCPRDASISLEPRRRLRRLIAEEVQQRPRKCEEICAGCSRWEGASRRSSLSVHAVLTRRVALPRQCGSRHGRPF